jgi:integrin-linked kinase
MAEDIHEAAHQGNLRAVKVLLDSNPSLITAATIDGRKPLHYAVSSGSTALVEFLLARGASVNGVDKFGFTPLHVAVALGHPEVAEILLLHGASVNAKHAYGKTPLASAIYTEHPHLIALLLRYGGRE